MKSIVQIGLIILAVMFVMKMMKGKRCEGFSQQQPQKVSCNCNVQNKNEPTIEKWGSGCKKNDKGSGTLKPGTSNPEYSQSICKKYYEEDYDGDLTGRVGTFHKSCNKRRPSAGDCGPGCRYEPRKVGEYCGNNYNRCSQHGCVKDSSTWRFCKSVGDCSSMDTW